MSTAVSRDAKSLYVTNRLEDTISVIDLSTRKVVDTWVIGGTPDMFQLSPDGTQLWVSGRYDGAVYMVDSSHTASPTSPIPGASVWGTTASIADPRPHILRQQTTLSRGYAGPVTAKCELYFSFGGKPIKCSRMASMMYG